MANLPPQLVQTLPETAAAAVSQLCEMAPGIPWSNQILDDMAETLKNQGAISSKLALSLPVDGIAKIEADLFCGSQKVKKEWKTEIRAVVHYYCGRQNQHGYEHPGCFSKSFPMDRPGVKMAIEFLQESVQNVKGEDCVRHAWRVSPPRSAFAWVAWDFAHPVYHRRQCLSRLLQTDRTVRTDRNARKEDAALH